MGYFKRVLGLFLVVVISVVLIGCTDKTDSNPQSTDELALSKTLEFVYDLAVDAESFDGTYEEWLETVRGPKGEDGKSISLQISDGQIQWQYVGESEWNNLVELSTLVGPKGEDGRTVDFQVSESFIQWRYEDQSSWKNLFALSNLVGETGQDGRQVDFQVDDGFIMWQYVGDSQWNHLIELSSLIGTPGKDGKDGREVDFQVNNGYIQWQYIGENTWKNLFEISDLLNESSDLNIGDLSSIISGIQNLVYVIGDEVPDYLENVKAIDLNYGNISHLVQVDDSKVNYDVPGQYPVSYFVDYTDGYRKLVDSTITVLFDDNNVNLPDNSFIVHQNGYWGIVGVEDEILIPIEYDRINYVGDNMLLLRKNDIEYYYNMENRSFIQYDYEIGGFFYEGLVKVFNQYEKQGFMNKSGEIVIPFIYTSVEDFKDGKAIVSIGIDNYGIIDKEGDYLIQANYDYISWYVNESIILEDNDVFTVLDSNLKELIVLSSMFYIPTTNYNKETVFTVFIDNKPALVDEDFDILVYTGDDECSQLSDGLIYGKSNGIIKIYDLDYNLLHTGIISLEKYDGAFVIEKESGKGVVDLDNGKLLIDPIYKEVVQFSDNTSLYKVQNFSELWGVVNDSNVTTLAPIGTSIGDALENGLSLLNMNNIEYAFISKDGYMTTETTFAEISDFHEDRARFLDLETEKYGFLDEDGEIVIEASLFEANDFKDGFAKVKVIDDDKGYTVMDKDGELLGSNTFYSISDFSDGVALVQVSPNGETLSRNYLREDGTLIFDNPVFYAEYFHNGYAVVMEKTTDIGFGLIDTEGNYILELRHDRIARMSEGLIAVRNSSRLWGYYNTNGSFVIDALYMDANDFKDGRASVTLPNSTNGIITSNGSTLVEFTRDTFEDSYSEGYIVFKDHITDLYGYYDTAGSVVVNPIYLEADSFYNGLAKVVDPISEKTGFINYNGKVLVDFEYDTATNFNDSDYSIVKSDNHYGLIDKEGNLVFKVEYESITKTSDGYLVKPFLETSKAYTEEEGALITTFILLSVGKEYIMYYDNGGWRLSDGSRDLIAAYDVIEYNYHEHVWEVYNDGLMGYYNETFEKILDPMFDDFYVMNEGYIIVEVNGDFGVYSSKGRLIVPVIYDDIYYDQSDRYIAVLGDFVGLYDSNGKFLLSVRYDIIKSLTCNIAPK